MVESILLEASPAAAASLFAALADATRLDILRQLSRSGPTCVCKFEAQAAIAPNLLSYHLKVLRDASLVETKRRGRWVDYSLASGAMERLHAAIPGVRP